MPILLKNLMVDHLGMTAVFAKHLEYVVMGLLISRYTIQGEEEQQVRQRGSAAPGPPPHLGADSDDR